MFSEDENHGPARKFLLDNNLKWDKTQILVIQCNNESEMSSIFKYNIIFLVAKKQKL